MALKHPIVPVVLGGSDYSLIAPENSYIDVKDFKNAQELAHHLNFLANNEVSFSFKGVLDLEMYVCIWKLFFTSRKIVFLHKQLSHQN